MPYATDDQGDKQSQPHIIFRSDKPPRDRDPPPPADENGDRAEHFLTRWLLFANARFELLEARVAALEKLVARGRLRVIDGRGRDP